MSANITRKEMLTGNLHRLFLRYLFPSVAATAMIAVNFFVDALCVGRLLGDSGLAALNIAQPAMGVLYGLGYLLGVGGSTLYSYYMGKGESRRARGVYTVTFLASLVTTGLIAVLGTAFLGPITTFLGGRGAARQGVMDYLTYVFLFAPVFTIETYLTTFLRNDNAPRLSMAATFVGSGLNIVLDILFMYGFGWGIRGASLATAVSIAAGCVVLLCGTLRKKSGLKLIFRGLRLGDLARSIRNGFPSFVVEMTASVVTFTFNAVLLYISGETAVAVYGVIGSLTLIVISGITGVSNAMQPLVSTFFGAGRTVRMRKILRISVLYSFGMTVLILLVGELWPDALVKLFIAATPAFLSMARAGVRIVFISYLFASANILLSVYFQSVQAAGEALLLTVLRGVVLPVLCVVGCAFAMGLEGVWYSTILAEGLALLAGLILYRRVRRRIRERNYAQLKYFTGKKQQESLDEILELLGAEEIAAFKEMITFCTGRDEERESIPAFVGLEDLTQDYEGQYTPAYDDEDMGLLLAVGGLLFTDLYEQSDIYKREKKMDESYPAAAPAMSALAERCFRFTYDEEADETGIIPYRRGIREVDEA